MIDFAIQDLVSDVKNLSEQFGQRVDLDAGNVIDRSDSVMLRDPGLISPNGSCRLLRARDGWLAVNFARPEDVEALEAWCGVGARDEHAMRQSIESKSADDLVSQARWLSMPVSRVDEVGDPKDWIQTKRYSGGGTVPLKLNVLDLSSLWAGPLCASIFAAMGANVVRVESERRPERRSTPHYGRLNSHKKLQTLDVTKQAGRARLQQLVTGADVIVTSSRFRAFDNWNLHPFVQDLLMPHAVWVAVSGHGWFGAGKDRVGFGDDAAAAGGLVKWRNGKPSFIGDALADPITGLWASAKAMKSLLNGGGEVINASLSHCAAIVQNKVRTAS